MSSPVLALPKVELGQAIPKIIYQTYSERLFTPAVRANIRKMLDLNPGYVYRGFSDEEVERFISDEYGPAVLSRYLNLSPAYGAARADLFRYLLIYRHGGVYLDIKSTITTPLAQTLRANDAFILSQWDNSIGRPYEGYGFHEELVELAGGEFQQWFLIGVAGHPFLRAVIENVLCRIDDYRPWVHPVGRLAVVRTTGPVVYTQAILPIVDQYPARRVQNESEIGLSYTFNERPTTHVNSNHYWVRRTSLTRGRGLQRLVFSVFGVYMFFARSYKISRLTGGLLPINRES